MPELPDPEGWEGFDPPRYTPVPDAVFDVWMARLSGAEFKVLCYICRRTFGFKKDADNISMAQMSVGIKRRDGSTLDDGTGLSPAAVKIAVRELVQRKLIARTSNQAADGTNMPNTFRLILRGEVGAKNYTHMGSVSNPSPGQKVIPSRGQNIAPQETVVTRNIIQESISHYQESALSDDSEAGSARSDNTISIPKTIAEWDAWQREKDKQDRIARGLR